MTPNTRGALLMMGSMAAFTLNDTCIKALGPAVPLGQMLLLRGIGATLLIWGLAVSLGAIRVRFPRRDWGFVALRTGAEVAAAYFFITALYHMPIANVTAVLQVLPLTVTLAGALFFGDAVGWRRMGAILIGFAGMLLIVRPGPEGFDIHAVYALAAVACVTVRDLAVRRLSAAVPSVTVALVASIAVTLFGGAMSLGGGEWVAVAPRQWALLAAASFFILGGYFLSVQVMRVGEVSFTAPFRYSGLLWALALGYLVFGDWPDPVTLLGATIVVGTGVFTLLRGARLAAQAKRART